MSCVYILYSGSTNKFYVGSSREDSADRRLKSHNAGKHKSTKAGRPGDLSMKSKPQIIRIHAKKKTF